MQSAGHLRAPSRGAVVSYWRKYVHEVLVNRLGGLSLPRKSVVRLTDRLGCLPWDVKQHNNNNNNNLKFFRRTGHKMSLKLWKKMAGEHESILMSLIFKSHYPYTRFHNPNKVAYVLL